MNAADGGTRRGGGAIAAAWVVMLVCVVVMMLLQRVGDPEPSMAIDAGPTMDQTFSGRLIVGINQLGEQAGVDVEQTTRSMLEEFEASAFSPGAHLRVVILEAELDGPEPARERLAAVLAAMDAAEGETDIGDMVQTSWRDAQTLHAIYEAAVLGEPTMDLTDEDRAMLLAGQGWFGRLALSHDPATREASPSFRESVLGEATRTVLAAVGVLVGLVVAVLVGLGLLILAVVLWADGRLRMRYRPVRGPTGPFLEAAALFLLLMLVLSVGLGLGEAMIGVPMSPLLYVLVPLAMFWPLVRGVSWRRWCNGMGWQQGAGVWREVGSGLVGYVAGLPIIALGLAMTVLLSGWLAEDADHPVAEELFTGGTMELVLVLLLAVVWAPVVEEAIFRGAFYHHMRRRWNAVVSGLVVGVIFAAIHPQGIAGIPVLTAVAVVLSMIREWRGSLIGPIAAHAVHNFGATMILLLVMR
ncbi:lysostaphin resistance A-like protein [Phycisphaerales bacterium AB-hyl4]|uniref:Lysostaphin resistance A-like protein n=1 Tax=Natronomicrosphaera hydrolytica TaxID=3242702 RepID=A0ABV4U1W3_9BACT